MSSYICLRAISHDYALVQPKDCPLISQDYKYSTFMEREVEKVRRVYCKAMCHKALRTY